MVMRILSMVCFVTFYSIRAAVITPSNTALVADGDSQVAAGTTFFFSLTNASTGPGFGASGWALYTNAASSGHGRGDIDNGYTNQARVYTNNWPAHEIVYLLDGGANDDLYTTTNRWLTNVLSYSNIIVRAQADHFTVVHLNLLPRNGFTSATNSIGWSNLNYKVNWSNYNAWAASTNNPAEYKLDWASLFPPSTFGNTNIWNEATPDELHLTLWANRVAATNIALLLTTNTGPVTRVVSHRARGRLAIRGGLTLQ